MNLQRLRQLGFDESYHIPFTKGYRVRCSQCEALAINGVPCHETGCPNTVYECKGCNNLIPYKGYCADCR
jgi:hypothetical protein